MHTLILHNIETLWRPLIYLIVFTGILLEGDIILFSAFYLVHQRQLDMGDTIILVIIAAILADILWYSAGSIAQRKPWFRRLTSRVTKHLDDSIRLHPILSIIVTKFSYGMHRPVLLCLHSSGIGLKQFLKADIPGALLWVSVIGTLGYLFAASISILKRDLKYVEIGLLIAVILFIIIEKTISKRLRKKIG